MSDQTILIVSAHDPRCFENKVKEILNQGGWRVAETEMSVTDCHYFAMLVREHKEENLLEVTAENNQKLEQENQRLRAECEELREALESISIESGCQAHGVKDPCDANIAKKALKSQGSKLSPTVTKFLLLLDTAVDKMEIVDASKVSMLVEALKFYAKKENYLEGSGATPRHSISLGEDVEHNYAAIPGDDTGAIAREALKEWEK